MDTILFLIFAAIAVICGINLVVQTHPISSALSLVGVMGALAALYLLLGGEFIAAAHWWSTLAPSWCCSSSSLCC